MKAPFMETVQILFVQSLPLIVVLVLVAVPTAKILARLGYSRALTILALIPFVNIAALWVLAYANWPNLPKGGDHA